MQKFFTVLDRIEIEKGLILTGRSEREDIAIPEGATVTIKRPDLPALEAKALGFELMRNCWSPHLPRPMAVLLPREVGSQEIPDGSEVWCEVT